MRGDPSERYLECMKGNPPWGMMFPPSPEHAYETLKKLTGQDFGWDFEAWDIWLKEDAKRARRQFFIEYRQKNPNWIYPSGDLAPLTEPRV